MNLTPDHLGMCSWSVQPKSPAELLAAVKEVGLRKVQLALDPVRENPAVWGQVKAELTAAGVEIASGMFGTIGEDYTTLETIKATGGIVPDEHWDANWKHIKQVAAIAQQMGLSLVSFHAGFIPHDPADPCVARLADRLRQIADLFKSHGLTLIFETGQETADDLWAFLGLLARDNVGVNFDPANMILYDKGDPIASLRKLLPRVRQVHIKDAVRTTTPGTWGSEVPVGDGQVDWKSFIATLDSAGFTGNLIIEREAGTQRVTDIRTAATRITALLR